MKKLLPLVLSLSCLAQQAPPSTLASGPTSPAVAALDSLMMRFLREQGAPGAALAVARDGQLLYARGFGYADPEAGEAMQPEALFRIASVSKPLTAVAVMQLVEAGRLALDGKVFELLGLAERDTDPAALDARWREVTVQNLLQHRGGWDRGASFDPMFRAVPFARRRKVDPPAGPWQIIDCMLETPLDFDPGSRYAYSNFGYCLLGRVIEAVTGQDYETAVREAVLLPCGAASTRVGATLADGRLPGEVCYVDSQGGTATSVFDPDGPRVPRPYGGWHLEAMDAHGGWVASTVDLVRFADAMPELLTPESLRTMFARPADHGGGPVWYACGWSVRRAGRNGRNTWHNGLLSGTSTLLVRRHDGFSWAVLFNSQHGQDGKTLAGLIDGLVHRAVDQVQSWPEGTPLHE